MPPPLALSLALLLGVILLWREVRLRPDVSHAVWIPCLWLFVLASRPISQWLNLSAPAEVDALMDGSPADRLFYLSLIVSGAIVIWRRKVAWGSTFWKNPWLLLFFAYCAISIVWSDYPLVSMRRWVKSLGDPLMVLILLTEANPAAAVTSMLRRCAFFLIPLSVVFIKYYPDLGRVYDPWSGRAGYTGVTTNKNLLGYLLMVFGLLYLCTLVSREGSADRARTLVHRYDAAIAAVFLAMIVWLFPLADSKTALLCLCAGAVTAIGLGVPFVSRYFGVAAVAALVIGVTLQFLFNIAETVILSTGRDVTFTGRTEIWAAVLELAEHPLIGAGFQSFWLGDRLAAMWDLFPVFKPNQAHNGYLEIYLNLGLIGLFLFCGLLVTSYRAARQRLTRMDPAAERTVDDLVFAKFGIGYLPAYLLYNVTEAVIQPLNVMFIIFLIVAIKVAAVQEPQEQRISAWGVRRAHPSGSDSGPERISAWKPRWAPSGQLTSRAARPGRAGSFEPRQRAHGNGIVIGATESATPRRQPKT